MFLTMTKPKNLKYAKELLENSVSFFNNPNLKSRLEQTVITLVTAWTHLLISIHKKKGLKYEELIGKRQKGKAREKRVKSISSLMGNLRSLENYKAIFANLDTFIQLRDKAIHKSSLTKDDEREVLPYLQTCINNFSHILKNEFEDRFSVDFLIPLSLEENFHNLNRKCTVKEIIESQKKQNPDIQNDPFFCKKIAIFIGEIKNNKNQADVVIKRISVDEEISGKDEIMLSIKKVKDTDVYKYKPSEVCRKFEEKTSHKLSVSYAHCNLVRSYQNDEYYIVDPIDDKKRYSEKWINFLINEFGKNQNNFIYNTQR